MRTKQHWKSDLTKQSGLYLSTMHMPHANSSTCGSKSCVSGPLTVSQKAQLYSIHICSLGLRTSFARCLIDFNKHNIKIIDGGSLKWGGIPKIIQVILCWWLEDLQLRNPHIKNHLYKLKRKTAPHLHLMTGHQKAQLDLRFRVSWLPRNFGMGFQSGTPWGTG